MDEMETLLDHLQAGAEQRTSDGAGGVDLQLPEGTAFDRWLIPAGGVALLNGDGTS